ncbi:hypothetical protein D9615_004550 [Tricholomella constricta]|uniref:Uncharacterized protein n=1 Tax=Tricholomella constricta TaxID=117010 RepID=A0A8H5HBI2_9AGAR|nr:hypothetical protein D9615_004550 [Tricholomella constricta]
MLGRPLVCGLYLLPFRQRAIAHTDPWVRFSTSNVPSYPFPLPPPVPYLPPSRLSHVPMDQRPFRPRRRHHPRTIHMLRLVYPHTHISLMIKLDLIGIGFGFGLTTFFSVIPGSHFIHQAMAMLRSMAYAEHTATVFCTSFFISNAFVCVQLYTLERTHQLDVDICPALTQCVTQDMNHDTTRYAQHDAVGS